MLDALMSALRLTGVECDNVYGEWLPSRLRIYDLVVIYHCNFTWSRENWIKTQLSGRPYVVLPIFYPTDALGLDFPSIRRFLDQAACVCPLSFTEAKEIKDHTGFAGPFTVIPHGTDERFHSPDGGEREYVMTTCARGGKGERLVEEVCAKLRVPYRHIMGEPHVTLPYFYKKAKVFVHSSPDDRMSLTVGEALCGGCRVLSSVYDRGNEWFPGLKVVNPESEMELEAWIRMAWESDKWDYTPNQQARKMSWLDAAVAWKRVMERVVR